MVLSVFGLGYVGCVSAACLASRGFPVVGVDVNSSKIEFLRRGQTPVFEERIGQLIAEVVESGLLTVSDDPARAVLSARALARAGRSGVEDRLRLTPEWFADHLDTGLELGGALDGL